MDCSHNPQVCDTSVNVWNWRGNLESSVVITKSNSVVDMDGSRHGIFLYQADRVQTITSSYNLRVLISNYSLFVLLARWAVALIALYPTSTIGIEALANSWSFHVFPLALLPRLKRTLIAFWTLGCKFEGNQRALDDAWFEIYPAIGEACMCYFSLLNLLAKVLRRRSRDWLFGPTVPFFVVFHRVRYQLANSDWFGFDSDT